MHRADAYLTLLRHVFLVDGLPAWHRNRLKRLAKAAARHVGDSGVGVALLGIGRDGAARLPLGDRLAVPIQALWQRP